MSLSIYPPSSIIFYKNKFVYNIERRMCVCVCVCVCVALNVLFHIFTPSRKTFEFVECEHYFVIRNIFMIINSYPYNTDRQTDRIRSGFTNEGDL